MGGKGAHGDLTGVGTGGFATRVGFSLAPLSTRPALPPNPLGLTVGEAEACGGAGDLGFVASRASLTAGTGEGTGAGAGAGVSSA